MSKLPHVYPTVVHMLDEAALQAPEREALVCETERLNYREYLRCVAGFAHELIGLGAIGGRIGIVLGNSMDICIAMFAIHAARAQAVPINPAYTERELRHIFQDADLQVVIYADDKRAVVEALADELGIPSRIRVGAGARRFTQWRAEEDLRLPLPLPSADDLATLQYTGGTTGRAKGVNLTHRAVAFNISQREAILPTRKDQERLLCVMPMSHIYAAAMCLHNMAYARGTLVILPRYAVTAVFDIVRRERITIFAGSPTLFVGLLAHPGFAQADFSSLYLSYSGSAALPEELLRRWQDATNAPVLEGYGQSETGPVLSFNPLHGERKYGSVGLPLPDTIIEIVDLEQGTRVLGLGEKGEIRVRGPQLMSGYRNLPMETAETLRDGWVYTGDIGEFDADGYLYIRDRKKEMAKVSGFNVFPREIEEVLYQHPSVREAAVVAVPDAYRGEVVKAFVVPHQNSGVTEEQLATHCHTNLAKYKWPMAITLLNELPKTCVGKIDKNCLREAQGAAPTQAQDASPPEHAKRR
ncbi:putative Long-chain-fatty-acid--CoA ligase [Georgfuchsia toluolica]|uniref:Long-chain-fatty-acid--CoA ligase n=1 Tax=Georgfuchsia toluolica TaxID=424218 RepID=A0A916J2V1_9PROT|nr:AMP-binding protein [Georgfuchsia toluolica]CAG4882813.1 putative Long-chain-fatty-acid--CoA ligase [Georgfuchsia toluolica]